MKTLFVIVLLFGSVTVFSQSADGAEQQPASNVKGITPARARALGGVLIGLVSVIVGWRAKTRAAKGGGNKSLPIGAVALGSLAIALSVIHLVTTSGGFGTGGGKAGAIVALVLGVIGEALGVLSLIRLNHRAS